MGLEVDDNGAVALSFAPGPVVDTDEAQGFRRWSVDVFDAPQQGVRAGGHGRLGCQPRSRFTTQGRANGAMGLSQAPGRSSVLGGDLIKGLSEDAPRAHRGSTEETADLHL